MNPTRGSTAVSPTTYPTTQQISQRHPGGGRRADTLRMLCDALAAEGYAVLVARDAEEALQRLT